MVNVSNTLAEKILKKIYLENEKITCVKFFIDDMYIYDFYADEDFFKIRNNIKNDVIKVKSEDIVSISSDLGVIPKKNIEEYFRVIGYKCSLD